MDKMEREGLLALPWVVRAGANLVVGHHCPWENDKTIAAGSVAASTLFCIHESVFPFHPLINCQTEFCGFSLHT